MNKTKHAIVAVLVIALMAFSSAVVLVNATATSYSALNWSKNQLVTANQLNVWGSSTVGPIASEEIGTGNFASYWAGLVSSNTGWGTSAALDLTGGVNLQTAGSGTAIPALDYATGQADVGEMSRPPSDAEWGQGSMTNMQIWAVGIDSVAIVVSPDMSWFPTNLNTAEVASLFADTTSGTVGTNLGITDQNSKISPINSAMITWSDGVTNGTQPNQGIQGTSGSTPLFNTWNDFFAAWGLTSNENYATGAPQTQAIQRAVRDPTSGTFDCFNNYFAVPNGFQFEYKAPPPGTPQTTATPTSAIGAQEMAPYTYCEENVNIYNTVSAGHAGTTGDYVGFISLGYYEHYGNMIGINIAYNTYSPPSSYIAYKGPSGTQATSSSSITTGYTWGSSVVPTDANVKYAVSGVKGSAATGAYQAWRWLWEVTPGPIPTTGPCLAAGVWIAYMRAAGTTNAGTSGNPATLAPGGPGTGNSNFVADNDYIPLSAADFAGGAVLDSNLKTSGTAGAFTVTPTQTQSIPTGAVSTTDFLYFVNAYIHYFLGTYNPYIDYYASGVIGISDFTAFVNAYIQYYISYNP